MASGVDRLGTCSRIREATLTIRGAGFRLLLGCWKGLSGSGDLAGV